MTQTTIIIPNYNGMKYLEDCLTSLGEDLLSFDASVIIVDNGSTDLSIEFLKQHLDEDSFFRIKNFAFRLNLILLPENTGFCNAVNEGIKSSDTPYIILLNNDTKVKSGFTKLLTDTISESENLFSVNAKMINMQNENILDNAGDLYAACGWAFARGKGKEDSTKWSQKKKIFSACGGASIYRREILEKIGLFDHNHFAYLEDVDIGWRARIYGYHNLYEPKALVAHAGSGASGSRYNHFKVDLSSANNFYIIWKNMPLLQILINFPFIWIGFLIKLLFFSIKGMGITYLKGCGKGIKKSFSKEGLSHKVKFRWNHLKNYFLIQLELWKNLFIRVFS